jgi:hypothetical protein
MENGSSANIKGEPITTSRPCSADCVLHAFSVKKTGPLETIVHTLVTQEAGQMWDGIVQFVGLSNVTISTTASAEFRSLMRIASAGGWPSQIQSFLPFTMAMA